MGIVMLIIFLFANMQVLLISKFAIGDRDKYEQGMLMGIHIPPDETGNPEVVKICQENKKQFKSLWRVGFISGFLVNFIALYSIAVFMLIWIVWIIIFVVWLEILMYKPQKQMYKLKVKNGWINESTKRVVHIDTKVSAAGKLAYGSRYHIPAVIIGAAALVTVWHRTDTARSTGLVLAAVTIAVSFVCMILHSWVVSRKNIVYSKDSEINLGINRMEKYIWSVAMLLLDYINVAAGCYMAIRLVMSDFIGSYDYMIYVFFMTVEPVVFVAMLSSMRKKKQELLSRDTDSIITDDDEYWKDGTYNNPDDRRILVQSRMSSASYTFNMAHRSSKIICGALTISILAMIIWVAWEIIPLINVKVRAEVYEDGVCFRGGNYSCEVDIDEVISVEILDKLPKDNYVKLHGAATDSYSLGHYKGKNTGKCMLFIHTDCEPVLKITLEDKTVYVNSTDEKAVYEWYEMLYNRQEE